MASRPVERRARAQRVQKAAALSHSSMVFRLSQRSLRAPEKMLSAT